MLAKCSKFGRDRGGAIAMMFAICLLPMVFLIALAIDFSFFTEARSQVQLASDAAATHAVRAATGTYSLETAEGISTATATADAISAGETAGDSWFAAQLGVLPTAQVALSGNANPNVIVTNTTNPSGFSAAVTYTGYYPPFFDHLFNADGTKWNIAGSSGAASQYSYVEIMMMLDTSQAMDIADSASNILTMNDNTVCIPKTEVSTVGDLMAGTYYPYGTLGSSTNINMQNVTNYTASSPTDQNGKCATTGGLVTAQGGTTPTAPCALACHTTNTNVTYNGFTAPSDLYGVARRLGVRLRIDDVFSAAENVVSSMIDTEQASDQFAVGIYQFNDDISGDKDELGNTIGQIAPGDGTNGNYEATYNLTTALSNLQAIDYNATPSETAFPPLTNSLQINDHNNFPQAVKDFVKGDATSNVPLKTVTTATEGLTIANPVKDVFIVTDGMEDSSPAVGRTLGEMTSILSETGQTSNAVCQKFKNLGFTVYVLYIPYDNLPNVFYANGPLPQYSTSLDTATLTDYPTIYATQLVQAAATGQTATTAGGFTTLTTPSPDQAAMAACASTTNGQSDLYVATDDQDINNELSLMLKSALSGAIRITN
jgi:Flp pilus assembly protein TadG